MKILLLLLLILVCAALGTHFSVGAVRVTFQYVLFITAGISAFVLISGATD